MLNSINRNALIITSKQPLLDWVNAIYLEDLVPMKNLGKHDQGNVYLIPEYDYPDDVISYLQENLELFVETELFDWCTDDRLWPKPFSWELFESWFHPEVNHKELLLLTLLLRLPVHFSIKRCTLLN